MSQSSQPPVPSAAGACFTALGLKTAPSRLAELVPGSAANLLAVSATYWQAIAAQERAAVTGSVAKRKAQFATGRAAARLSAQQLGRNDLVVPMGPAREPLWPEGIVGSISHTEQWAIAWLCHADGLVGLGVDLEPLLGLDADVCREVLSEPEREMIHRAGNGAQLATVMFSVKESIYKALYPAVQRLIDFTEVSLHFDKANGDLVATIGPRLRAEIAVSELQVGYFLLDRLIISWATHRLN